MGGVETVGPFIADGYSRTAYYNLDDAAEDIPALRECLDNLSQFDVLIMKNYDRLGSLGMPLYYYLSQFKKQLHSVQQATPIYPPEEYNPNKDSSVPMMITMAGAPQIYRIQKITDNFLFGNQRRAKDGKPAMRYPMGYNKTDKKEAELDPTIGGLIAQFPGWLLDGATLAEIGRRADASGIRPGRGRWTHNRILYILQNPFYCGKTFHDRAHNDTLYDGKHEPLWTWDTYLRIQAELERRREIPRRKKSDYNFTGLLICSECGKRLHVGYDSRRPQYKYWRCPNNHVTISTRKANKLVADELRRIYSGTERTPTHQEGAQDYTKRKLAKNTNDLSRLEQAYFAGAYTPVDYATKKRELESERDKLQNEQHQKASAERRASKREKADMTIRQILPHVDEWLTLDEPASVAYWLGTVLRFTAHPDKRIVAERLND